MADDVLPSPTERRETRLLGALALTLTALATWQVAMQGEPEPPVALAQAVRPPGLPAAPDAAPRDTSEIVERPLFLQGRRRPSPISAAVAAAPPPPPPAPPPLARKYMLVGTLVIDGRPQAMLREIAGAGPTHRLRQGDTIDGWTLAAIEPRRAVRFAQGDTQEALRLAHPQVARAADDDDEEEDE